MEHHERALAAYAERASRRPEVLGVIATGSVGRGTERPDSDIDLYLVVTEDAFARAVAEHRIIYVDEHGADWDHGYFDIKVITPALLDDAAERGDEPMRDSLRIARVVWDRGEHLAERIAAAAVLSDREWDGRVAAQVPQVWLHAGYFLDCAARDGDPFLAASSAVHAVTAAHRTMLALHRTLYTGPKRLRADAAALPGLPAGWIELTDRVLAEQTPEAGAELIAAVTGAVRETLGGEPDFDAALSDFVLDNELAWRTRAAVPEYR
jgi:predicted nucleotidyltransferase